MTGAGEMTEDALGDPEEPLFRQVHPTWIQEDRLTSQAFRPTPKDKGQLSVSRGSMTTAAAAFELHTRGRGLVSAGVWAVQVADCSALGLPVYPDPLAEPVDDPAHAVVDFRNVSDKEARAKSQVLRSKAEPVYVRKAGDP